CSYGTCLYVLFFFKRFASVANQQSFPTRRSSDLSVIDSRSICATAARAIFNASSVTNRRFFGTRSQVASGAATDSCSRRGRMVRSEEHTSELQSRENLVCRLLLEKKKAVIGMNTS